MEALRERIINISCNDFLVRDKSLIYDIDRKVTKEIFEWLKDHDPRKNCKIHLFYDGFSFDMYDSAIFLFLCVFRPIFLQSWYFK